MKPFEFVRAGDVEQACQLLADRGPDAVVIAGGQSIMPLLKSRSLTPAVLVDISRVPGLSGLRQRNGSGALLGPTTTYRELLRATDSPRQPQALLAECARNITDLQVRAVATVGGSACFAAAAYDMPPALTTLDAGFTLCRAGGGQRRVGAQEFFLGARRTARAEDELLTEIDLPALPAGTGWAVERFAAHQGFAAIAWVGARVGLNSDGSCRALRVVLGAVEPTPVLVDTADFAGAELDGAALAELAATAAAQVQPVGDPLWGGATYKRELVRTLTQRALDRAMVAARSALAPPFPPPSPPPAPTAPAPSASPVEES